MPRDPALPAAADAQVDHAVGASDSDALLYARVIKRLGRNARPLSHDAHVATEAGGVLDEADAFTLWRALLDARFSPAQEAALLMGLRVHGESGAMLAAFARACDASLQRLSPPHRAVSVVLHCAGRARRQPTLAPLVALCLQQRGVPVIVVTPQATGAGDAAGVLRALGRRAARDIDDAQQQLHAGVAWLPLPLLSPALARVFARRAELGFRNSAHAVVKLLSPVQGDAVLACNYTHSAYRCAFEDALPRVAASALLMRGAEGDPVLWDSAAHAPRAWWRGEPVAVDVDAANRNALDLPAGDDAAAAAFTDAVLRGAVSLPPPIAQQVQMLCALAHRAGTEAA